MPALLSTAIERSSCRQAQLSTTHAGPSRLHNYMTLNDRKSLGTLQVFKAFCIHDRTQQNRFLSLENYFGNFSDFSVHFLGQEFQSFHIFVSISVQTLRSWNCNDLLEILRRFKKPKLAFEKLAKIFSFRRESLFEDTCRYTWRVVLLGGLTKQPWLTLINLRCKGCSRVKTSSVLTLNHYYLKGKVMIHRLHTHCCWDVF